MIMFFLMIVGDVSAQSQTAAKDTNTNLTIISNMFLEVTTKAMGELRVVAYNLAYYAIAFELVFFGILLALGLQQNSIAEGIKKLIIITLLLTVIQYWAPILDHVFNAMIWIGAKGGMIKDPLQINNYEWASNMIRNPASIVVQAAITQAELLQKLGVVSQTIALVTGAWAYFAIGIFLAYCVLAVQVFITVVEFYIFGALSIVFLPFSLIKQTRFIFDKMLHLMINLSIKVMVVTFLLGLISPLLHKSLPVGAGLTDLFTFFCMLCCIVVLIWHAPAIVASVINSNPGLGQHHAIGMATAATMMVVNQTVRLATAIKSLGASEGARVLTSEGLSKSIEGIKTTKSSATATRNISTTTKNTSRLLRNEGSKAERSPLLKTSSTIAENAGSEAKSSQPDKSAGKSSLVMTSTDNSSTQQTPTFQKNVTRSPLSQEVKIFNERKENDKTSKIRSPLLDNEKKS
jgi:type IV secretion system protein TrbL